MNYSFLPDAESELIKEIEYYELCRNNLGMEFAKEVYSTILNICENPFLWGIIEDNIRRRILN